MKYRNKKPNCPICGSEIELKVFTKNGYGSSICGASSLLGGSTSRSGYECSGKKPICRVGEQLFEFYTSTPLLVHGDWRLSLKTYWEYVDFAVDNELLLIRMKAASDNRGSLTPEIKSMFLEPAIKHAEDLVESKIAKNN